MADRPMVGQKVADALRAASAELAATSDTARLDAELLMAHALGLTRSDMLLRAMRDPEPESFATLVERRRRHEPVAYIVGHQEFYGLDLAVGPEVLIPRGDSETLVEAARVHFAHTGPRRICDLGTGSGALLIAALSVWPNAEGVGIDTSPGAVAVARQNACALVPDASWLIEQGDWRREGWQEELGRFDLVLCNPPYVETGAPLDPDVREHEPASALFAGADGLDDYRVLIPQLPALLEEEGVAILEIGASQADAVAQIASAYDFVAELNRDLAQRPRALLLRKGVGKGGSKG